MRTAALLVAAWFITGGAIAAAAQGDVPASVDAPRREGIAIGGVLTPALEGGGPWFLSSIRLSAPLGSRFGIDADAGRIAGAVNKYAEIRRFYAVQLRILRATRSGDGASRYWLVGPVALQTTRLDGRGGVVNHDPHYSLTIGRGWDHVFSNGVRGAGEVGLNGGDGFLFFASVIVQWQPRH